MLFEIINILYSLIGQKKEYIIILLVISVILYFLYNNSSKEIVCPKCEVKICPEIKKEEEFKRMYNKLDEITKPSNLTGERGYIGRDQICYRSKLGDTEFMKKRPYCMACQVDIRKGGNVDYDGTYTNVMKTCLYADNHDPNDPTVWTKDKCTVTCRDSTRMQDLI